MHLVEQHVINNGDSRYAVIDRAAFTSKNLYNADNYGLQQSFIRHSIFLSYEERYHLIKNHEASVESQKGKEL